MAQTQTKASEDCLAGAELKYERNHDVRCNFATGTARLRVAETDLPGNGPARAIAGSLWADHTDRENASKVTLQLIYTCPAKSKGNSAGLPGDVTLAPERRTILALQYTSDNYPHGSDTGLSTTLLRALDAMARSVLSDRTFGKARKV